MLADERSCKMISSELEMPLFGFVAYCIGAIVATAFADADIAAIVAAGDNTLAVATDIAVTSHGILSTAFRYSSVQRPGYWFVGC
mmetsp:Transcript_3490/g.3990  ORF Transcript_3490/g.3990 Transcript_3490/m.3990 type:complete len:85 (-) Transcript_3490:117-371(-)